MKINGKNLKDGDSWNRFKKWVKENLSEPDLYDRIDWDALVDRSLSFEEAADEVRRFLPSIWTYADQRRIKKIVFVKPLIEKIKNGEVQVTYRNRRKTGLHYVVSNRFKEEDPEVFIEFYRSEVVDVRKLTDMDAQLAGVKTAKKLKALLSKWYGKDATIYRNWFRVKHIN